MNFFKRLFGHQESAALTENTPPMRVACRADLWCRKRTSISTMLDPDLYAQYMTGVDQIDEDWVIQSNPPCSFKADFKEGCETLLELLQIDPGLHATKGWLQFIPPAGISSAEQEAFQKKLQVLVRTAERELKTGI